MYIIYFITFSLLLQVLTTILQNSLCVIVIKKIYLKQEYYAPSIFSYFEYKLKKEGIDDLVLFGAICAHNPKSGVKAKTKIQYALLAADPMSGFLKAVAQIYPDKKIASVKRKSVIKRFNEARFAKGANRDYMESIEFTGLMLEDLIDIGLEEMCAISDELGL